MLNANGRPFWQCSRCGYKDYFPPRQCYGCGNPYNDDYVQIEPGMFEKMQYQVQNGTIKTNNKKMTTLGNMMKRLLDKDTQTLVKAGYINGDLELTDAGKKALWAIIFTQNKDALVTEAQEALDAEKTK